MGKRDFSYIPQKDDEIIYIGDHHIMKDCSYYDSSCRPILRFVAVCKCERVTYHQCYTTPYCRLYLNILFSNDVVKSDRINHRMIVNTSIDGSGSQFIYPIDNYESMLPQNLIYEYKRYKNIDDSESDINNIYESLNRKNENDEDEEMKSKEKEMESRKEKKEGKGKRKMKYDDDDDEYVDSESEDYY